MLSFEMGGVGLFSNSRARASAPPLNSGPVDASLGATAPAPFTCCMGAFSLFDLPGVAMLAEKFQTEDETYRSWLDNLRTCPDTRVAWQEDIRRTEMRTTSNNPKDEVQSCGNERPNGVTGLCRAV